jgi:hypothetical protein
VAEGFDLAIRIGPVRNENLVVRKLGACGSALSERRTYSPGAPQQLPA